MSLNKYTLDRFEGDYGIFLKHPEETDQLLIHRSEIRLQLNEGDFVSIQDDGERYIIQILSEETSETKKRVESLLNELKNQNKK
ncbi:DUF3006 domain-containing protein [Ureibacillus sp. NPDC094379]